MAPCNFLWGSLDGPPPQDLAPNKIVFRLVFRPKLAQTVLEYIKKAAVISIHKEVHRQTFFRMVQGEKESVNTFIAKLKAQAALCDFTVNSSCSKANCAHQQSVSFRRSDDLSSDGEWVE